VLRPPLCCAAVLCAAALHKNARVLRVLIQCVIVQSESALVQSESALVQSERALVKSERAVRTGPPGAATVRYSAVRACFSAVRECSSTHGSSGCCAISSVMGSASALPKAAMELVNTKTLT
jgi:hypothetical protein